MYKQLKNDGFTLVEIIVSIAIGSVVLGLILSIILTSFNLFGNVSRTDLRKSTLDNIQDYVRTQILNAEDVYIGDSTPNDTSEDDWKSIFIKKPNVNNQAMDNDVLWAGTYQYNKDSKQYIPTEKEVFGSQDSKRSFYKSKSNGKINYLEIKAKLLKTNNTNEPYRCKLSYKLYTKDSSNQIDEIYTKKDTVKFLNIRDTSTSFISKLFTSKSDDGTAETEEYNLSSKKFFYKSVNQNNTDSKNNPTDPTNPTDPDDTKKGYTGTIVDKLKFMTPDKNRGYFLGTATSLSGNSIYYLQTTFSNGGTTYLNTPYNNVYHAGDFVYFHGYWWMLTQDNQDAVNINPENGGGIWQKMDENYHDNMYYLKGDVIKYKDMYFQCLMDYSYGGNPPTVYNTVDYPNQSQQPNERRWKYLGTEKPSGPGFDINWNNSFVSSFKDYMNDNERDVLKSSPAYEKKKLLNGVSETAINYDDYKIQKYDISDLNTFNTDKFETVTEATNSNGTVDYKKCLVQVEVRKSSSSAAYTWDNDSHTSSDSYYRLYEKIFDPIDSINDSLKIPGNSCLSGWRLLENSYVPSSSYKVGDTLKVGTKNLTNYDSNKDYIKLNEMSVKNLSFYSYYNYSNKKIETIDNFATKFNDDMYALIYYAKQIHSLDRYLYVSRNSSGKFNGFIDDIYDWKYPYKNVYALEKYSIYSTFNNPDGNEKYGLEKIRDNLWSLGTYDDFNKT